jgi:protein-S-isoprenylcysteine O-methyltransferase Ste14
MTTSGKSRNYAVAQSVLFCLFAVAVIFGPGPVLFGPGIARLVGNALCAAGLVLMLLGVVALREVIQVAPEPRVGGRLVTSGLYRRFRHPIYTGIVIVAAGLFLRRPTALVAIAAGVTIAFLVIKTRFEESLLQQRYPDYAEYRKRALGVIPWLT